MVNEMGTRDALAHSNFCWTTTESYFRHPLFVLGRNRKVENRHTNFHFSSNKKTKQGYLEQSKS